MKKTIGLICGLSVLFFSCGEEGADAGPGTDPAQRIYLRAMVENAIPTSRTPYMLTAPDARNPLKVAVWASTTQWEFKDLNANGTSNSQVALHTTANFTNGAEQLLNDAVYPKDKNNVYFVGLHPETESKTKWTTDDAGKIARMTFNGSEDVMFAPHESGEYGGSVDPDNWPTFSFKHLLTWLRVRVKSDSEEVSEAWGRLKSLKVKSKNTVTIDLDEEYNPDNSVTFSPDEDAELDFYATGTNDVYVNEADESTWESIPFDKLEEVAYVLCAPVIASEKNSDDDYTNEYTLIVQSENRTVEVPVELKMKTETSDSDYFIGSTMNHQFILNLNFKMGDNIIATASVTEWKAGGLDSADVEP